jgi:hypothetical protein
MNKAGFLFLGAVMSMGSLLVASTGCGDEASGGSGGSGGDDVASSSSSKASSSAASTSASSGGATVKLTCDDYCAQVQKNCTGDVAQYGGPAPLESCKATCASWAPGALTDTMNNTLGCRIYHSGTPAMTAAAMHCGHAGLIGGDLDPAAGAAQCGDGVEAFCKLAVSTCKGADVVWADEAACKADAAKFKASTTNFSATKDTAGDTFSCRAYHLTVAAGSAAAATMHCKHIAAVSETCKP